MPPHASTCDIIIAIVAETFVVEASGLGPQSSAIDVPGWDSVTQVGLLMRLEDEFAVEIDVAEANAAADLEALAALIDRKRKPS
ncbi:MAG: acyl carrier protein [Roseiarcus sp.]